jgi:putative restriction endonuclease
MAQRNLWSDKEMILVLALYFKLPFGRLNRTTREVKELAKLIGRTDNSVALRLVNYAACDPYIFNSGRSGMTSGRSRCMPFWNEYANNKEKLFLLAETYKAELKSVRLEDHLAIDRTELVGKERKSIVRQRINQYAFRAMILANYESKCAITGINIPELLVASHIIPWADNESERLNPENGICLSPLYDKAFDSGLIGIRDDYTVILSRELKEYQSAPYFDKHFKSIEDKTITLPIEHWPNTNFLEYHYNNIFSLHN